MNKLLTDQNLTDYIATDEKFTFCLDLLGLSLVIHGDDYCEAAVDHLQTKFETMIGTQP